MALTGNVSEILFSSFLEVLDAIDIILLIFMNFWVLKDNGLDLLRLLFEKISYNVAVHGQKLLVNI